MHPIGVLVGHSGIRLWKFRPYLGLDFGALPQQYRKLPNVLECMLVSCTGVSNVDLGRRILHEVDER